MKRAILAFALALAASPAASPAAAQTVAEVDAFLAAVEEMGCVVNEANNAAVLARLGITAQQGTRIVTRLMADGRAVPQGDDLRIVTGHCK